MKTYFLTFQVIPTKTNEHYDTVKGALASCWVLGNDPQSALAKAEFLVSKGDWEIKGVENFPIEVTQDHFQEKDIGLQQYMKAQENEIAIFCAAYSKDGKTTAGPITLKPSYKFDISTFLKTYKKFQNQGRCLHYDSNERCREIINAHSIQRRRSLSEIAHKGHVYRLTSDISTLKKSKGKLAYQKRGINNVSTFLGFCKKHDNELFGPIDNYPLRPTDEQIFLYGYRSLCRELFVKENFLNSLKSQLSNIKNINNTIKNLLIDFRTKTAFGLDNLKNHKSIYDNSLREKSYRDIRYVLFISKEKPFMAFSGLIYPDFDFMGRQLQDLGDHDSHLELITFCSAPTSTGWGFLFSWHKSSSNVCVDFMKSLATMMHANSKIDDLLFRMVISNCENHAISPQWWEKLSTNHKEQIIAGVSNMADIFAMTKQTYLVEGLEGMANWNFENVISNME